MAKAKKPTKKVEARRTGRPAAKKVRNRASSTAKEAAAGRMAGPSIPLRELVRDGMPRSAKARGFAAGVDPVGPQVRRRMKTAHGLKMGGGIAQNQPRRPEHIGSRRTAIANR